MSLVHARVFTAIRDAQKPLRKAELADRLGMDCDSVGYALRRLLRSGWVRSVGTRNTMTYVACREGMPADGRGRVPPGGRKVRPKVERLPEPERPTGRMTLGAW